MPRKTKLTPERQERIIELLRAGNYIETACRASGIGEATFHHWMNDPRPLYKQFQDAVKKAQAEAEARNLVIIQKAAQESWQAAAWYLERKWPERWGRRMTIEGGTSDKPIWIANARDELIQKLGALNAGRPIEASGQLPEPGISDDPNL